MCKYIRHTWRNCMDVKETIKIWSVFCLRRGFARAKTIVCDRHRSKWNSFLRCCGCFEWIALSRLCREQFKDSLEIIAPQPPPPPPQQQQQQQQQQQHIQQHQIAISHGQRKKATSHDNISTIKRNCSIDESLWCTWWAASKARAAAAAAVATSDAIIICIYRGQCFGPSITIDIRETTAAYIKRQ